MKELLRLQATYNKEANHKMIAILQGLESASNDAHKSLLHKDLGMYYTSILGTLEHYSVCDVSFFATYFSSFCENPPRQNHITAMLQAPFTFTASISGNAAQLFAIRGVIDAYMQDVIEAINEQELRATKTLDFPWGAMTKPVFQFLTSIFNHATHHRGMIASALDSAKIDNDFNGMLAI